MQMLLTLLQQVQAERDEALAARVRAQAAEQAAREQAEQLLAYRQDYERRWREQFALGGAMALLTHYQSFAARLTQAIEQQRQHVQQLQAQRERVDAVLAERELKLASTAKLIERRRADEARSERRHERKLDDELGARVARIRTLSPAQPEGDRL